MRPEVHHGAVTRDLVHRMTTATPAPAVVLRRPDLAEGRVLHHQDPILATMILAIFHPNPVLSLADAPAHLQALDQVPTLATMAHETITTLLVRSPCLRHQALTTDGLAVAAGARAEVPEMISTV